MHTAAALRSLSLSLSLSPVLLCSPLLGSSERVGKREVAGGAFASEEGDGIMYCASMLFFFSRSLFSSLSSGLILGVFREMRA